MQKIVLSVLCCLFMGCAAAKTAATYKNLDVTATTERQIFLSHAPKTVFLTVESPIKEFSGLAQQLSVNFTSKGYTMASSPEQADLLMAVRLTNMKEEKISARKLHGPDPAPVGAGAVAGSAIGYVKNGIPGAIVGGVAGTAAGVVADLTINSWVHLGVLDVYGNVQLQERIPREVREKNQPEFKDSGTMVWLRAQQAGLDWTASAPAVQQALIAELSRLLPYRK